MAQVEPGADARPTRAIAVGGQFRLPPTADRAATTAEVAELEALTDQRAAIVAEVSTSCIAAGIHVRSDQTAAETIGRQVADLVMARAGAV